jgi:hypothetical protein
MIVTNPPPPSPVPQTLTVQYDATELDGVTPSVSFSRDDTAAGHIPPDDDGIYRVDQNGPLGLVDPSLGVGGSMGDRFILWMEIMPDAPSIITVQIVDAQAPTVVMRIIEPVQPVVTVLYRSSFFRVPQGGLLRIIGTPGVPARVRLRISIMPDTCCDDAAGALNEITVQDDGVVIAARPILNFIGPGVTVTDDPANDRVDVEIPGEVIVQDEGALVGASTTLNFVGDGVTATFDAGNDRIDVEIPGDVAIQNEGVLVARSPSINFTGGGVTVVDDPGNERINVDVPAPQYDLAQSPLMYPMGFTKSTNASTTAIPGVGPRRTIAWYFGRVASAVTLATLRFRVITGAGASNWYEIAVARGRPIVGSTDIDLEILAAQDALAQFTSSAIHQVTIPLAVPAAPGDDLWLLFGADTGSQSTIRADNSVPDDLRNGAGGPSSGLMFQNSTDQPTLLVGGTMSFVGMPLSPPPVLPWAIIDWGY